MHPIRKKLSFKSINRTRTALIEMLYSLLAYGKLLKIKYIY